MAIAESELDAAVQVLHVRHGRVVGRQGFILEKVEDLGPADLVARALGQHYAETPLGVPREILVPAHARRARATYADWLSGRAGPAVTIHVPRRGHKRALIGVAEQNAAEQLVRHRTRRATDLASRARALEELQRHLGLARRPFASSATT